MTFIYSQTPGSYWQEKIQVKLRANELQKLLQFTRTNLNLAFGDLYKTFFFAKAPRMLAYFLAITRSHWRCLGNLKKTQHRIIWQNHNFVLYVLTRVPAQEACVRARARNLPTSSPCTDRGRSYFHPFLILL